MSSIPATPSSSAPSSPHPHNPDDPDSLLKRSIFLSRRGRLQQANDAVIAAIDSLHSPQQHLTPYLVQLGSIQLAQNNLSAAEHSLRRALAISPDSKDALCGLAHVLTTVDPLHLPECLHLFRRAAAESNKTGIDPSADPACSQLAVLLTDVGVRLKLAGLPANAIQHYNEAISISPKNSHTMYNLAVAHADAGDSQNAINFYQRCLQENPSHVEAWCNLGVLHRNDGRPDLAMRAYEQALSINPNFELAKRNLAAALCERATTVKSSDQKTAKRMYKRALALQPCLADAHYNIGVLYAERGKYERALMSYNLAAHFKPDMTEAHNNLGVVHKELGNMEMALQCYKRALLCDTQHHQTHNNIAVVYTLRGDIDTATHHLRAARSIAPTYAEAHNNLGVLLRDQGDIDDAITCYEKCIQLDPTADMAAQNRLHALSYSEFWSKSQVYEEHVKWGASFQSRIDTEIQHAASETHSDNPTAALLRSCMQNPPQPNPQKPRGPGTAHPLRIGYLSPDFFTHSVSYFAEVLLNANDREGFEVYVYANVAQPDKKTERFRQIIGNKWRNIWGSTASTVAKLITDDRIDILVELAGHTANNRLDVMALRLAPVQVTWIGYPNTTGLKSIHYRVTDGTVDPVNTSQKFSETLWRLPDVFLCYTPAAEAPKYVSAPPMEESGGIVTFGSFNVLPKTQKRTVQLWASILREVPRSRLLLKAKPFAAQTAKKRMEELFEKEGIPSDRLDLVPLIPSTRSHLDAYSNIDVALDPFPYAGTTTTCEALYMGVPVITLGTRPENGDHAHNVGVTLLSIIGHEELVAYTEAEYIAKAVDLANDTTRLKDIRRRLRADMMNSPLGDRERFIRNVEAMYCGMWRDRDGITSESVSQTTRVDSNAGETYPDAEEDSVGSTTPRSSAASDASDLKSDESADVEDEAESDHMK